MEVESHFKLLVVSTVFGRFFCIWTLQCICRGGIYDLQLNDRPLRRFLFIRDTIIIDYNL